MVGDSRISDIGRDGEVMYTSTLGGGVNKITNNKQCLLGAAGDLRAINLLAYAFAPPVPPVGAGKRLDAYMTLKFIPELRACFDLHGYSLPERDSSSHIAEHGSTILVGVNGVIYCVDSDYSWIIESSGIFAIGTGAQYALGALQVLCATKIATPAQAKKNALKAIAISAKYDPYTGGPFHCYIQEKS